MSNDNTNQDTPSQRAQIRRHLEAGGTLTALAALYMFGCWNMKARICEIRRALLDEGDHFRIITKMIQVGPKKWVAQYEMIESRSISKPALNFYWVKDLPLPRAIMNFDRSQRELYQKAIDTWGKGRLFITDNAIDVFGDPVPYCLALNTSANKDISDFWEILQKLKSDSAVSDEKK